MRWEDGKDWEGLDRDLSEDNVLAVFASAEWNRRNIESKTDVAVDNIWSVVRWDRVMWRHVEYRPKCRPHPNTTKQNTDMGIYI
jgi:hypothetical protein